MNYWQTAFVSFRSNYLPAYKAADIYVPIRHYICREPSTNQLIFMQNKPNLPEGKIDAKYVFTKAYENKHNWILGENKPNQTQSKPILVDSCWILSRIRCGAGMTMREDNP